MLRSFGYLEATLNNRNITQKLVPFNLLFIFQERNSNFNPKKTVLATHQVWSSTDMWCATAIISMWVRAVLIEHIESKYSNSILRLFLLIAI